MRLRPTSRVYATWTFTGTPPPMDVALEVSPGGDVWHLVERNSPTTMRLLLAGPDAPGDYPAGTVVLPLGRTHLTGRANDNPELVVFDAGTIDVL